MDNQDPGSYMPQAQTAAAAPHSAGWVAFEYVLMFIGLSFAATGVAGLLHHLVDNKISIPTDTGTSFYSLSYYSDYLVPFYISSVIIGFPVFVFLALRLKKLISANPEVRKAKVRKLAIYLALVWTFMAMMIRLERTVYEFIKGDAIVANTICHLIVTLLIAGSIFMYFAMEVKQDDKLV